jgi:hypothetical protein
LLGDSADGEERRTSSESERNENREKKVKGRNGVVVEAEKHGAGEGRSTIRLRVSPPFRHRGLLLALPACQEPEPANGEVEAGQCETEAREG